MLLVLVWIGVAALGAFAFAMISWARGEHVGAAWLVIAAACTYTLGYRFYGRFVALRVLKLDDRNVTPAVRRNDGHDFVPTNRWVVYGHHFAAIAGPGPLIGPILAAQFGYLPGTIWILVGAVLGGAVQDFVILVASLRRDGRSLVRLASDCLGPIGGIAATLAVLLIIVILIAVLGLVIVKALADSPWGVFTVAATIPIALIMGTIMRGGHGPRVGIATAVGVALLGVALVGGHYVSVDPTLGPAFTLGGKALAWSVILYGLAASTVPIWLLLAPRDYLSTFVKLGTILALAIGILAVTACILFVGLVMMLASPKPAFATGQNDRGGDYIMLTQQLSNSVEGIVVIDAASKRMSLYTLNSGNKRLDILQRNLPLDRLPGGGAGEQPKRGG